MLNGEQDLDINLNEYGIPHPDTGWSRGRTVIENAVFAPPVDDFGPYPTCGVFDKNGDVPTAAHWRENKRVSQPVCERPKPTAYLSGTHIYGGFLFGHFGHFLVESLTRLWVTDEPYAKSFLFMPRRENCKSFRSYQTAMLDILAPDVPAQLVSQAVEVERLIIPGQAFGLGAISRGTPEFRSMLRARMSKLPTNGPKKIYISRTLHSAVGGVLNEEILEENFAENGYTIMHPQKMSISEQLIWYNSAEYIVGVDSSAFHLYAFVGRPDQKVALILRRNVDAVSHIVSQIEGMIERQPTIINSLVAEWMPERYKFGFHQSLGEANHDDIRIKLISEGFLKSEKKWRVPTSDEALTAVRIGEKSKGETLVRRVLQKRIFA
ncbi:glycosyltransferase family 61 protein (plasmid) [Paracoccus liaowanqingii]|uniref:Glycosyltransferase family 61 protein n=1 Tax=Paracoccus liaowanqingii TaxID=2560053 RepID=A0A4Y5SQA7_9RHOB|nr:glycosyltransferase family 61 protein [Paracoccus liaowanqingii]